MMTQPRLESDPFFEMLESFYKAIWDSDSLQKVRAKAWDHFLELGLPSRNFEAFRYIRLRNLYARSFVLSKATNISKEAFSAYIYPECKQSVLVFVNGHFQPSLSNTEALPSRLAILPLTEAMRTYGSFLNNQWAKGIKEETDPFAILNAALHKDAAFIYLPPKSIVEAPLQILNVVDAQDMPMMIMPRLQVFAGAQSQIDILSTQAHISGDNYFINQAADFSVEESSRVRYTQIACEDNPQGFWQFDATRATLKRDSSFKTVCITDGKETIRFDYRASLAGENAEALLNGVWMLSDKREAHTHVLMEHQAPFCRSMQLYKGVLNDISRSSFEGKILVRQAAQKTEAFQLNNNLLLSDHSHADSKPNLEIFADDVKASHGATVGQLDPEQLFYMKTRGFSTTEAKNFLVYSFCKEVIDLIGVPSVSQEIIERAQKYLTKSP